MLLNKETTPKQERSFQVAFYVNFSSLLYSSESGTKVSQSIVWFQFLLASLLFYNHGNLVQGHLEVSYNLRLSLSLLKYHIILVFFTLRKPEQSGKMLRLKVSWSMFADSRWSLKYHIISISLSFSNSARLAQGHLKTLHYHRLHFASFKFHIISDFAQLLHLGMSGARPESRATWSLIATYRQSLAGLIRKTELLIYMYFLSSDGWWLVKLLIISMLSWLWISIINSATSTCCDFNVQLTLILPKGELSSQILNCN